MTQIKRTKKPKPLTAALQMEFQQATAYHQNKQLDRAATLYQKILEKRPNHADSLHLLGLIHAEQNQLEQGLDLITQAIRYHKNFLPYYLNRGILYQRMGNPTAAIADFKKVLEKNPREVKVLTHLGDSYQSMGDWEQAVQSYQAALNIAPDDVTALHQLGNAYLAIDTPEKALSCYEKVLAQQPDLIPALSNKGIALAALRRLQEAIEIQRQVITKDPHYVAAYENLGLALTQATQFAEAEQIFKKLLSQQQSPNIYLNLGNVYKEQGRYREALQCFQQAHQMDSSFAEAEFNLAITELLLGDWINGWRHYESRFRLKSRQTMERHFPFTPWQGETIPGKTLLIHVEQGLGDALQLIRYLPQVAEKGGDIILECHRPLLPLFEQLPIVQQHVKTLIEYNKILQQVDYHIALMSLPYLFKTTLTTVSASAGYIDASAFPEVPTDWLNDNRLKVGFVWAGSVLHKNDHNRSIAFEKLAPIVQDARFCCVSFQVGDHRNDRAQVSWGDRMLDGAANIRTFVDTVALVHKMDVLITVDTAMAHLGGAMGHSTWVLLPFVPDFRWLLERDDTPWYDSVRLFRQTTLDDWDAVIANVHTALVALSEGKPVQSINKTNSTKTTMSIKALQQFVMQKLQEGNSQEAEVAVQNALSDDPQNVDVLQLAGVLACQRGDLTAGIHYYEQAIKAPTPRSEILYNLALAYQKTARWEESIATYEKALSISPHIPDIYLGLANVLQQTQQLTKAIEVLKKALSVAPRCYPAQLQLGLIYQTQGKEQEAITAFSDVLTMQPHCAEAYNNRGVSLQRLQKYTEAIKDFNQAIQLKPQLHAAYQNLGSLLAAGNQYEQALSVYQNGLMQFPNDMHLLCGLMSTQRACCHWKNIDTLTDNILAQVKERIRHNQPCGLVPFQALTLGTSPELQCAVAENYARVQGIRRQPRFKHQRNQTQKPLRIGYISPNFRNHPTAQNILGLLSQHQREHFEVRAYSLSPDDGSVERHRIVEAADAFIDLHHVSDDVAAKRIYEDGVDLLISLMGYIDQSRLNILMQQPSPIQIGFQSYQGTLGTDVLDYFIADKTVVPLEHRQYYHESLIYLPQCYYAIDVSKPTNEVLTREECGLPEDAFVFCCFCSHYKIEPTVFDCWMEILKAVPNSVLWLFGKVPFIKQQLHDAALSRGISMERIIFATGKPKAWHLARHRLADLALDTFICNGHTTTVDALKMGLPVITVLGESLVTRVSASLLKAVGLPQLIATNLEDYQQMAIDYAQNPEHLQALKTQLQSNIKSTSLFNLADYVEGFEKSLQQVWQTYLRGENLHCSNLTA